jgi:diaminohydroxyphosphoribosylaminopyrimidine deaminase/5-amino-6-(5-phosphoribosylamino)uracil reductase
MPHQRDRQFMARAIELAKAGRFTTTPNPNVGCVLVKNNQIVGEGYHHKAGEPHAEINALSDAGDLAVGSTAYVTLEPCSHYGRTPPCAAALIHAGVKRVVAAMQDPNPQVAGKGLAMLRQAGIDTEFGLLADEAEALNRGFLKRMRTGLPYIQLKLAASLDGRTAMASGESQWITSAQARGDVQIFRAQSSAILSTSATVIADNPSLTVRWSELPEAIQAIYPESSLRQPIRIIIDGQRRLTPDFKLFSQFGESWLIRPQQDASVWPDSVTQCVVSARDGRIDLLAMMKLLGERQINTLWVEAGAGLAGALLQEKLVDELILYLAPKVLGSAARGLFDLPNLTLLSQAPHFSLTEVVQIGPDLRLRFKPVDEDSHIKYDR